MTAKELKRLRRSDLLEMLLTLRKENDDLRAQLAAAQEQLKNRDIEIARSGTLADAAVRLNGVLEATQAACEQYVDVVRRRMRAEEEATREKCDRLLALAREAAYADKGEYQD